jgi:plasmid maintenance system killer protein
LTTSSLSERAAKQLYGSAARIPDAAERERFIRMMVRAAELAQQSKELRVAAWARYRQLTGLQKGQRSYA